MTTSSSIFRPLSYRNIPKQPVVLGYLLRSLSFRHSLVVAPLLVITFRLRICENKEAEHEVRRNRRIEREERNSHNHLVTADWPMFIIRVFIINQPTDRPLESGHMTLLGFRTAETWLGLVKWEHDAIIFHQLPSNSIVFVSSPAFFNVQRSRPFASCLREGWQYNVPAITLKWQGMVILFRFIFNKQ